MSSSIADKESIFAVARGILELVEHVLLGFCLGLVPRQYTPKSQWLALRLSTVFSRYIVETVPRSDCSVQYLSQPLEWFRPYRIYWLDYLQ